jgi:amicoumacin kinase
MIINEDIRQMGADRFAVDPNTMRDLNGTDGAVYSCRLKNREFIIKFIPAEGPEHAGKFEEKLAFIAYLSGSGVQVAAPQPSIAGRLYEFVEGDSGQFLVTLMPRASGRHAQGRNLYDWNERLFHAWGQTIGKMHALTQKYPLWCKAEASSQPEASLSLLDDWEEEHRFFTQWNPEPKIIEQWMPLYDELARLPRERNNFGLIHNDLHQWNFLYNPEVQSGSPITIIDFDVCTYHWFITDISIAMYHAMMDGSNNSLSKRQEAARKFLPAFRRGYCLENDLDLEWWQRLPLFLRYREILLYIALTNSWPEEKRQRWQTMMLSTRRRRILNREPVLTEIEALD